MNEHGLTRENLLSTFPAALAKDPAVYALAEAAADLLAGRLEEIKMVNLYAQIDRLEEPLLDILAQDFKVDWWNPGYTLEEKRRTLRDSWKVHRTLGTKAAVVTAISAIYPKTDVQEWFEYGGEPFHFKIKIDLTGEKMNGERPKQVLERVRFYKSLRSHLEELVFTVPLPGLKLRLGGGIGACVRHGIPAGVDECRFQQTLHTGGSGAVLASAGVPEDPALPPTATILRTGGVCTIISNSSKGE